MRAIAIGLAALVLAIPSAGVADVSVQRKEPAPKNAPLRARVTQLEVRVKRLENQVAILRVLVCLQIPNC